MRDNRVRWVVSLTLVGVAALLAFACGRAPGLPGSAPAGDPAASSPPSEVKKVKLGLVGPQTGAQASLGLQSLHGVAEAVEDINASGGIKSLGGAQLELVVADHEGKPELALSGTLRLIERDKVSALIGALLSAATFPATQVAEERRVPIVVPLGIADGITERGFRYTFRASAKTGWGAPDRATSLAWIARAKGKNISRVALLYEDTEFGQGSAQFQLPALEDEGYDIVADVTYPSNASDMSLYVTKVKESDPDIVLLFGYTADAINITKTMYRLGLSAEVMGTAGTADQEWIQSVGALGEGTWVSHLWAPDLRLPGLNGQGLSALVERSTKRWNVRPIPEWAIYYQSTWLLKEAFERSGSTDRERLRDALAKLEYTGPAFTMPFHGNKVTFGPDGQTPESLVYPNVLMQVQDGKFVTVYPPEFAAGKPK